jgi:chromosome segregation ATPase
MLSLDVFAIIGAALGVMLLAVLFLLPGDKRPSVRNSRATTGAEPGQDKDWRAASLKLEKYIHALKTEIEHDKAREKNLQKEILIQKEKYRRLQEKISQERGWQDKETADKDRRAKENSELRQALQKTEEDFQREHGDFLRLDRELKETKAALSTAVEAKRGLDSQIFKMQAQLDAERSEVKQLRDELAKLKKQHDETTWVAKSEYVKVQDRVSELQKECERLRSMGKA